MPWRDIHCRIKGDIVHDLARNFIQYWYFTKRDVDKNSGIKNIKFTDKNFENEGDGKMSNFSEKDKIHRENIRNANRKNSNFRSNRNIGTSTQKINFQKKNTYKDRDLNRSSPDIKKSQFASRNNENHGYKKSQFASDNRKIADNENLPKEEGEPNRIDGSNPYPIEAKDEEANFEKYPGNIPIRFENDEAVNDQNIGSPIGMEISEGESSKLKRNKNSDLTKNSKGKNKANYKNGQSGFVGENGQKSNHLNEIEELVESEEDKILQPKNKKKNL